MTLAGKRVLVTGANGFIGSALVLRLLAEGAQVRGLVRSAEKGAYIAESGAEIAIGDLRDSDSLRAAVAGCGIVFHIGAAIRGTFEQQTAANVDGTLALLRAAHDAGVRRFVHVSTIAVYGYHTPPVITESVLPRPEAEPYGQSKAHGEALVLATARELGIDATVIRPGMVYGPRSGFWTLQFFNIVQRLPVFPGGGKTCPVVFIDDVVDLLCVVAEHPRAVGEAFNAVSDPQPTWEAYFHAYAAMSGRRRLVAIPVPVLLALGWLAAVGSRFSGQPQPVPHMVWAMIMEGRHYSMAKAADLLDWRPRTSLEEGMAAAEAWLKQTGRLP